MNCNIQQGQPSGEAFIQMDSENSAFACATQRHHRFMMFGKKHRYIEVFQCSGDDMNLVLTGAAPLPAKPLLSSGTLSTHTPPAITASPSVQPPTIPVQSSQPQLWDIHALVQAQAQAQVQAQNHVQAQAQAMRNQDFWLMAIASNSQQQQQSSPITTNTNNGTHCITTTTKALSLPTSASQQQQHHTHNPHHHHSALSTYTISQQANAAAAAAAAAIHAQQQAAAAAAVGHHPLVFFNVPQRFPLMRPPTHHPHHHHPGIMTTHGLMQTSPINSATFMGLKRSWESAFPGDNIGNLPKRHTWQNPATFHAQNPGATPGLAYPAQFYPQI